MDDMTDRVAALKERLDALRHLSPEVIPTLRKHLDVELTYSSNAIEGNTLTLRETAEVIEHGITVGGKHLRDHLEAVDHYDALQWMREQAEIGQPLDETTVTELHRRIVARSNPEIAGIYSRHPRRIAGSPVVFPDPAKVPQLKEAFGASLAAAGSGPANAFAAHYGLVAIHPFADGNGRTARLLMNLMLIRSGYPPVAVRPEERSKYLAALERASLAEDLSPLQQLLNHRLAETLEQYVGFLIEAGAGS